jgi:Arc/MetJ-type ribon-helix-helix transcriptional regulator
MVTSQMTSMRVPEDHMLLLDQRVGFDGMKNRSDVIRAAIALYLDSTPTHANVRTVKFDIGLELRHQLDLLYELRGTKPAEAARIGLESHLRQVLGDNETVTSLLELRVEELRARTLPHEDHTE